MKHRGIQGLSFFHIIFVTCFLIMITRCRISASNVFNGRWPMASLRIVCPVPWLPDSYPVARLCEIGTFKAEVDFSEICNGSLGTGWPPDTQKATGSLH